MLTVVSEATVRAALHRYEQLFSSGDVAAILDGFADDVEVRYGAYPPFTGKERQRSMLRQRFARMRDYRLSKRLEFVCGACIAASWTGSWIDVHTGAPMEVLGVELLTVRDGGFCRWTASVSSWRRDEAQQ